MCSDVFVSSHDVSPRNLLPLSPTQQYNTGVTGSWMWKMPANTFSRQRKVAEKGTICYYGGVRQYFTNIPALNTIGQSTVPQQERLQGIGETTCATYGRRAKPAGRGNLLASSLHMTGKGFRARGAPECASWCGGSGTHKVWRTHTSVSHNFVASLIR